jgi:hypothetical protein
MILTMNQQSGFQTFLRKLGGYYLVPHELLHVLAYRIIGKPCHYEWGDYRVQSSAPKTQGERLFILLLPVVVCLILSFFFHFVWVALALSARMSLGEYILTAPRWHFVFHGLANVFMLYSGTAYRDVRRALQILFGQEKTKQKSHKP